MLHKKTGHSPTFVPITRPLLSLFALLIGLAGCETSSSDDNPDGGGALPLESADVSPADNGIDENSGAGDTGAHPPENTDPSPGEEGAGEEGTGEEGTGEEVPGEEGAGEEVPGTAPTYEVEILTEDDGLRNGPDYKGATVYYPVDGEPPYAAIAIVPGYISPEATIADWGPFYAKHGYVAMTIGTNAPEDSPTLRSLALLDALETLRAEHLREGSPLQGLLDEDRFAVSGWSMGGGGAQEAALADPRIAAIVALCPWTPNATYSHDTPVLIFGGEYDTVAAPDPNAYIHYQNTPATTPKLYFEVTWGTHWVANSPTGGNGEVGSYALAWLKLFLDAEESYTSFLKTEPESASRFLNNL